MRPRDIYGFRNDSVYSDNGIKIEDTSSRPGSREISINAMCIKYGVRN